MIITIQSHLHRMQLLGGEVKVESNQPHHKNHVFCVFNSESRMMSKDGENWTLYPEGT